MKRDEPPSPDALLGPTGRDILRLARAATGVDFALYRPATLQRAVAYRMRATGSATLEAYAALIERRPPELCELSDALLIRTTGLFRDPPTFSLLRERALPDLFAGRATAEKPLVLGWVAGCSTGEEAWSLGMCLLEAGAACEPPVAVRVIASDVEPLRVATARKAVLSAKAVRAVPAELAARWLEPVEGRFRPAPALSAAVTFAVHDLLSPVGGVPSEAVFSSFDVIVCRNVLIYLLPEVQAQVVARLVAALEPGGLLVLGEAEAPSQAFEDHLQPIQPGGSVWRFR